ncbi:hypothetical protein FRC03_002264 [Tulasnella sp. 419]|nr:hypothetical protein FRC03_002264 [Tulasnella sp. 419]
MSRSKRKGRKPRQPEDQSIAQQAASEQRNANQDSRLNKPSLPEGERRDGGEWQTEWTNAKFVTYYKKQKIVDGDEEWELFMETMRKTLPTTFRLSPNSPSTPALIDLIEKVHVPHLQEIVFEGQKVEPPKKLPWYPWGLAYQFEANKRVIRKVPEFKKLHQFLVYETEVGNVSRQEAVSMIPPLLLDVHSHHVVLDACASPGSKTAQILEALHSSIPIDPTKGSATTTDPLPTMVHHPKGLVIANDTDLARAHMLIHQSARRIPSVALMVTNLDAGSYNSLKLSNNKSLSFDRILCDVPCSGDGTLRKNVGIWKVWNVASGNGLHGLQLRILLRAMRMLKPGGKIVYSTCSLNPVENEAVVAAALNTFPGQYRLPPTSHLLPDLKRRPGLTHWTPAVAAIIPKKEDEQVEDEATTTDEKWNGDPFAFQTYEDFVNGTKGLSRAVLGRRMKMLETHWPPKNVKDLGLENCMRVLPHLQDTGGFFVCLIEKLPRETSKNKNQDMEVEAPAEPSSPTHLKRPAEAIENEEDVVPLKKAKTDDEDEPPADENQGQEVVVVPEADVTTKQQETSKGKRQNRGKGKKGKGKSGASTEDASIVDKDLMGIEGVTGGTFTEQPFTFIDGNDPILKANIARLNLLPSFPKDNLYVRSDLGDTTRRVLLCNDLAKEIISYNAYDKIRLISAGLHAFVRQDAGPKRGNEFDLLPPITASSEPQPTTLSPPHYKTTPIIFSPDRNSALRFVSDGVEALSVFVSPEGKVQGTLRDLKKLIESYYPTINRFEYEEGAEKLLWNSIQGRPVGSYIIEFKPGEWEGGELLQPLVLPLWRSGTSISVMLDKQAKS